MKILLTAIAYLCAASLAVAQPTTEPSTQPDTQPATSPASQPATQPATAPESTPENQPAEAQVDPDTRATLDRIAAKGKGLTTLTTRVIYDREQGLIADVQRRIGTLTYDAGPPARFVFHIKLRLFDGRAEQMDTRYIFDGRWMAESKRGERTFRKWQVVPPDADPALMDPLARGDGPFVLPLKFETEQLLKRFDVVTVPPAEDDPENTVHLQLTPRPGFDRDLDRLDVWWHRETLLPVRAENRTGRNRSVFQLQNIEEGVELPAATFDTSAPGEPGWDVTVTPWDKPASE